MTVLLCALSCMTTDVMSSDDQEQYWKEFFCAQDHDAALHAAYKSIKSFICTGNLNAFNENKLQLNDFEYSYIAGLARYANDRQGTLNTIQQLAGQGWQSWSAFKKAKKTQLAHISNTEKANLCEMEEFEEKIKRDYYFYYTKSEFIPFNENNPSFCTALKNAIEAESSIIKKMQGTLNRYLDAFVVEKSYDNNTDETVFTATKKQYVKESKKIALLLSETPSARLTASIILNEISDRSQHSLQAFITMNTIQAGLAIDKIIKKDNVQDRYDAAVAMGNFLIEALLESAKTKDVSLPIIAIGGPVMQLPMDYPITQITKTFNLLEKYESPTPSNQEEVFGKNAANALLRILDDGVDPRNIAFIDLANTCHD